MRVPSRSILLLMAGTLALAACGQKAPLEPLPGEELPVAPYGKQIAPGADELLELEPQAAPERNVELRRRSEDREDDPFDLPPES